MWLPSLVLLIVTVMALLFILTDAIISFFSRTNLTCLSFSSLNNTNVNLIISGYILTCSASSHLVSHVEAPLSWPVGVTILEQGRQDMLQKKRVGLHQVHNVVFDVISLLQLDRVHSVFVASPTM